MKKLCSILLISSLSSLSMAYELHNGKIIQPSHFVSPNVDAAYIETRPVHAMNTGLQAHADVVKVAINYKYHSTTDHSVYIINDSNEKHAYEWYFESCPQYYSCIIRAGAVELQPGGSFCESAIIQPGISYSRIGIYTNTAITETKGFDPKYISSIAPIQVS
jgi:hypothetical protein